MPIRISTYIASLSCRFLAFSYNEYVHVLRKKILPGRALLSGRRLVYLGASLVCAGILVIVMVHSGPSSQVADASSAAKTSTTKAKTTEGVEETPAAEQSPTEVQPDQSKESQTSSPVPHTTPSSNNSQGNPKSCSLNPQSLEDQYAADLQKAKDNLTKQLSFITPVTISSQFVTDYNQKITDLYQQYEHKASIASCSFELQEPTLLPLDYNGQ